MQEHIQYNFLEDGHFAELKEAELLKDRIDTLSQVESYVGTFFSKQFVLKKVLNMNDAQIAEECKIRLKRKQKTMKMMKETFNE